MNPAIVDIVNYAQELIDVHGADAMAKGLENQGWVKMDGDTLIDTFRSYFLNEVFEDELDAILEEVYTELVNVDYDLSDKE